LNAEDLFGIVLLTSLLTSFFNFFNFFNFSNFSNFFNFSNFSIIFSQSYGFSLTQQSNLLLFFIFFRQNDLAFGNKLLSLRQ